ncbi:MAG TPA: TIGR00341 family protein [Chloroflexi bacterium]|nr:TIGR00341 family protein [Chloroflexota bacterium]
MPKEPDQKHVSHTRTGNVWRLPEKVALGLVATVGMAVLVLIGSAFQLTTTGVSATYLLTGLFILLLLIAYLERITATSLNAKTVLDMARQTAPVELVYSGGWLLIGGAFGLAGLFAWGIAIHTNTLLADIFQWDISNRWLTLGLWFFLIALNAKRTFRLPGQQTIAVGASVLFLTIIIVWGILHPATAASRIYAEFDNLQLNAVVYLSLMLWGMLFVLDKQPFGGTKATPKHWFYILAFPVILGTLLGITASLALFLFPDLTKGNLTPLASLGQQASFLVGLVYVFLVIWVAWYGFKHAISIGNNLIAALTETEFFLPDQTLKVKGLMLPHFPHSLIIGFIALVIILTPNLTLGGLAIAGVLAITLFIFAPEVFRSEPSLPEKRPFKLPLHPLFPATASLASVVVLAFLPLWDWVITILWLALGVLYYFTSARKRTIIHHQQDVLVGGEALPVAKTRQNYMVLVYVDDLENAAAIIRSGAIIARLKQGRLLVLLVLELTSGAAPENKREEAEQLRQSLADKIEQLAIPDVPVESMVRISHKTAVGIRDTIWEDDADYIVFSAPDPQKRPQQKEIIKYIINIIPDEVAIVTHSPSETIANVLVPLYGSSHDTAALKLAQELVRETGGKVTAFYQSPGKLTNQRQKEAQSFVQSILDQLDNTQNIEEKIIFNTKIEQGVLDEAVDKDMIIMGLRTEGIFRQTQLNGRPLNVAQKSSTPTLLIKREEGAVQYAVNRTIGLLTNWLPDLTAKDRSVVGLDMRHKAVGDADFYVLLSLAAAIAYFGLVQDSTAVIIGAMLIAPLMNPMMAIAFGISVSNFKLIGAGANTTLRGIIAAIAIATLLTIFLPPQPATDQILSRTQPTYLDLLVALFSGAAGAYAMTRVNLAGAIPGVAIAAALVPPLGVVGYGLGTGRLDIAGGALLLFVTNLAAIVLAAALVFLVMGFQPRQDMAYKDVWHNLRKVLTAILIISIPLLLTSVRSAKQSNTELTVTSIIQQSISPDEGEVTNIIIDKQRFGGLYVSFVLYAYQGYSQEDINQLQKQLSQTTGETVTLQVTTINATLSVINTGGGIPTPTPFLVDAPTPDLTAVPPITRTRGPTRPTAVSTPTP